MDNKHTPGPWRPGKSYSSVVADYPTRLRSEDATEDEVSAYGGHLIAESIFNEADKRLIAAAPDLLEAIEDYLNGPALSMGATHKKMRAAVAKARGA